MASANTFVTFSPPIFPQTFSIPDAIIYYLTKHPSTSTIYQKLTKSCKYFFVKNPVTIFDNLYYFSEAWLINEIVKIKKDDAEQVFANKVWITEKLHIQGYPKHIAVPILKKIFRIDISALSLFDQVMALSDFLLLTSTINKLNFFECTVFRSNGSKLAVEEIFSVVPKLEIFIYCYRDDECARLSAKNLLNLPKFKTLKKLHLDRIPDNFDIQLFYDQFMKKTKITNISLYFKKNFNEGYKKLLETIVNEIIEQNLVHFEIR